MSWNGRRSLEGPYPYPARPEERARREALSKGGHRVLRGGALRIQVRPLCRPLEERPGLLGRPHRVSGCAVPIPLWTLNL